MITLRTEKEIDLLREANQRVARVLQALAGMVKPGVTTATLDAAAEELIRAGGDEPSFKGYHGYPGSTCISVDETVVHGIPGARVLEAGQIVSIDVGVLHRGYHGDAAVTVPCGAISAEKAALLDATNEALARGIQAARAGNRLVEVGRASCRERVYGLV